MCKNEIAREKNAKGKIVQKVLKQTRPEIPEFQASSTSFSQSVL